MNATSELSIEKLWICPPLAFARYGQSTTPMENFHWADNDYAPRGTAETVIKPAQTFVVGTDGTISAYLPNEIRFRDGEKWRPVCPFFEVHGRLSDGYEGPIGLAQLDACGLSLQDVEWTVETANRKAFHYTAHDGDHVTASVTLSGDRHEPVALLGRSPADSPDPLVMPDHAVELGAIQVIKPNGEFPELRLRITPPKGLIYAPSNTDTRNLDLLVPPNQDAAAFLKHIHLILNPASPWAHWTPGQDGRTNPGGLYAQEPDATSLGFLDDSNDGLIRVRLKGARVVDGEQTAYARYTCCPQDFQPDRRPFVSIADGLSDLVNREQVLDPAYVDGDNWHATEMEIADFMQRVRETMEASNLDHQNLRSKLANEGITPINPDYPFKPEPPRPGHPLPLTELGRMNHARFLAYDVFKQRLGQRPELMDNWIRDPVAEPTVYDSKMPAMMRGSDSYPMTLTQRQYDLMRAWPA
ncbi:MAG: hypothetical protein ACU84J_16635, partial [Gammaproteobacteria bacterium]